MSKKSIIITVKNSGIMLAVYLIQFVLMPMVFPNYYPRTAESSVILFATLMIGFILGICFVSRKMRFWILPDILYGVMILIYSGKGLYGIGFRGISLDGAQPYYDPSMALISVGILLVFLPAVQAVIVLLANLIVRIFRKK